MSYGSRNLFVPGKTPPWAGFSFSTAKPLTPRIKEIIMGKPKMVTIFQLHIRAAHMEPGGDG